MSHSNVHESRLQQRVEIRIKQELSDLCDSKELSQEELLWSSSIKGAVGNLASCLATLGKIVAIIFSPSKCRKHRLVSLSSVYLLSIKVIILGISRSCEGWSPLPQYHA
jgi:hypothetical protein